MGSVLATRRNRQLAKLCIALLVIFGVCCGPYFVADIVIDGIVDSLQLGVDEEQRVQAASNTLRQVLLMLAFVYGWIMPLVYTIFNQKVRVGVVQLLHRCCCFGCADGGGRENRVQPVMIVAHVHVDANFDNDVGV